MKFIEKQKDKFDLYIPKTEVDVASGFISDKIFEKKLTMIINIQYENIFSSTLHESGFDIIKFSYNRNCTDTSSGEFGFVIKNKFFIIDFYTRNNILDGYRGITKLVYKVYKMEFHYQYFQGTFPFEYLENESTEYKFIKINLSLAEVAARDFPF